MERDLCPKCQRVAMVQAMKKHCDKCGAAYHDEQMKAAIEAIDSGD